MSAVYATEGCESAAREGCERDAGDASARPPHLQSRESKKEKREIKSRSFRTKLEGDNGKISKSSLRRQKRKAQNESSWRGSWRSVEHAARGGRRDEMHTTTTPFIAKPAKPVNPKSSSRSNEKVVRSEIDPVQ
jgi:hypothetical protein